MKKLIFSFLILMSAASKAFAIDDQAYNYVQTTATATVKTAPGILHAVTITNAQNVPFTIYDSTHVAGTSAPIAVFLANASTGTYVFDVKTQTGIQHVGAANGAQVTISYR